MRPGSAQGGRVSPVHPDLHLAQGPFHGGEKGEHDRGRPGQCLRPRCARLAAPVAIFQGNRDLPPDPARGIDPGKVHALAAVGKVAPGSKQRFPGVKLVQPDFLVAERFGNRECGALFLRCAEDDDPIPCPDQQMVYETDARHLPIRSNGGCRPIIGGLPIGKRCQHSQGTQVGGFHERSDRTAAQIDLKELRPEIIMTVPHPENPKSAS